MAAWLQSRLRAAEGILEAVDRTAKVVKVNTDQLNSRQPNLSVRTSSTLGSSEQVSVEKPSSFVSRDVLLAKGSPTRSSLPMGTSSGLLYTPDPGGLSSARQTQQIEPASPSVVVESGTVLDNSTQSPLPAVEVGAMESSEASSALPLPREAATEAAVLTNLSEPESPALNQIAVPQQVSVASPYETSNSEEGTAIKTNSNEAHFGNASVLPVSPAIASVPASPTVRSGSSYPASREGTRNVVDQELAEVRELASSAGQGTTDREARLTRLVERMRARLEQYKEENEQLEELLQQADARYHGGAGTIEALEESLAKSEVARISAEAALSQANNVKDAEIARLNGLVAETRGTVEHLESTIRGLQSDNAMLLDKQKEDEDASLKSLREEVTKMETRLQAECGAHAATRRGYEARVHELEAGMADSAAALARMQRTLDERNVQFTELKSAYGALETQVEGLQRSQAVPGQEQVVGPRLNSTGMNELAHLRVQCESLKLELAAARKSQLAAEQQLAALHLDATDLRAQLEESGSQAELEQRLKEVTELLYIKQTQLEKLAAEKAAQQLAMEREVHLIREEADRVKRRARTSSRAADFVLEEVVPMDAIGEAYYRLANHQRVGAAVQAGARFVDVGTSTIVRVLKQHPLARVAALLYAVFIHLFVYFLLQRLQHRAIVLDMAHPHLGH